VDWATVMPRLRVITTTPTSLKTAFSDATDSAFCERSMPYSFTNDRAGKARTAGYVVHGRKATGESV